MAGDDELIIGYLARLRAELAWRGDVDDVVAEAEDHLRADADRLERGGVAPAEAQRTAIARFGEPHRVARAFATTPSGGIAAPTPSTRTGAVVAVAAAALWLGVLAFWAANAVADWDGAGRALFFAATVCLLAAGGATCVTALVLRERHGNDLGVLGAVGIAVVGLGTAVSIMSWAVPVWMTAHAVGLALVATALLRQRIVPWPRAALLGLALPAGATTFAVARALEVGTRDEWGDYPVATNLGVTVGTVLVAAALAGIGHWLATEPVLEESGSTEYAEPAA